MKKNLRSKILLCVLAGGVLAANTALAEEYNTPFLGSLDANGVYDRICTINGKVYTYNVGENGELIVSATGTSGDNSKNAYGILITKDTNPDWSNAENTDKITIADVLDIYVNGYNGNYAAGIAIQNDSSDKVSDKVIDRSSGGFIFVTETDDGQNSANAMGVDIEGTNNEIFIGNSNLEITAKATKAYAYGLNAEGTNNNISMGNGNIKVYANTNADVNTANSAVTAAGINVWDNSGVDTENVNIEVKATGNEFTNSVLAYGLCANSSTSIITIDDGNITVTADEGKGNLYATGVLGSGVFDLGIVNINAETTGGGKENSSTAYGIYTFSGGSVDIDGGVISAKSDNKNADTVAIMVYGNGLDTKVNVNNGTNNDVIINGDVLSIYGHSFANLNLNTQNSQLNGAVYDNGNGISINLANAAEWNNTGTSTLNTLSMDNGIINQNTNKDIDIKNYSGSGEIVLAIGDNTSNGDINVIAGRTYITSATEGSVINMSVNNNNFIGTTDSAQALANLNQIANEISYDDNNGHITGKVTIKEGLIMPEASGDLLFDQNNIGYVANVKQNSSTTTIDNIKNIAATAIVAWRQEDSTLSQRLGELRESDGGQGIWVRMSRGEFEYDGEYKNQYNFFQMGYDWAAGSWHYGAAVSHNDGQTTYTHGDGENRSTSLSLYGTWLGDKGHYADIVLKQGRLSNDFDIYTEAGHTSGDYDAWGTSLSGEYGMKVDLDGGWYVTPQAQLTLMRIGGEDYTTNNGIKVNQDSLESAVGRVGFEVGKRISDSGSIYAKASLLHDFAGSADTYLSLSGLTNSYHQDIGDTWCEAGIGFNYKTSENSYVYADVVKTFGGDVETPWQWNAGMRWTF